MTLQEFIRQERITLTFEIAPKNPNMEDSAQMNHWKVVLWSKWTWMTTYFSKGLLFNGEAPNVDEVLDCLASDAQGIDQPFEDWASDFGYDPDSRKAEKVYKNIQRESEKLKNLLGEKAYKTLLEVERL